MKRRTKLPDKFIWVIFGVLFAVAFTLWGVKSALVSTVALEQSARCGAEEHLHGETCYEDGLLCCGKQVHTHGQNCYLLLLKDNDVNRLLSQVDADPTRNLETLIRKSVGTALRHNSNLVKLKSEEDAEPEFLNATVAVWLDQPAAAETEIAELDVEVLNETIVEHRADTDVPDVVFNEKLYNAGGLPSGQLDTVVLDSVSMDSNPQTGAANGLQPGTTVTLLQANSGVSTLALGDTPSTSNRTANIYINLDDSWRYIGNTSITTSRSGFYYTATLSTTTVLGLINGEMGSSLTWRELDVEYATSLNTNSWSAGSVSNSNVTLGTQHTSQSAARTLKYVRVLDSSGSALKFYTVTFNYLDGTTDSVYVCSGDSVQLPEGCNWTFGGNEYTGGQSVPITGTTAFTARTPDGSLRVAYDVNFPAMGFKFGDGDTVYEPDSPPTLAGTAVTTITDRVEANSIATIRAVSSNLVISETTHKYEQTYPVRFMGWQTETGELISPNTNLSWAELEDYANGDYTVELTGVWLHGTENMANFYVLYNAKVGEATGDSELYTPSIFSTHVGGTIDTGFKMTAATDEAAYQNDGIIRAMYGSSSGDMWFDTLPDDNYIFEQLRKYANSLTVEGVQVNSEDLNSNAYAIRWYKVEHFSDGWHIDGKLTRKKGQITVDKEFFGNAETIVQAEDGFHIVAVNGTRDANGVFTAYRPTNAKFKQNVLVLNNTDRAALASRYPNAEFLVYNSTADYAAGQGYQWLIEDVELGECWQVTEVPTEVPNAMYYAEYSVYDTDGNTSTVAEYGTTAEVVGKTFALDEDPDQGLLVDFRNYYYPDESILIKKEDGDTGQPIGGAAFELWQYNSEDVLAQLRFSYDTAAGQYVYDNNGSLSRITTGDAGYTTITTTGFSYDHGAVVVKEVLAPGGYDNAPDITLEKSGTDVSITEMVYGNGTVIPAGRYSDYAEVYDSGSVLVVKDRSSRTTSVTVNKVWADSTVADSVTVVLQANDTTATNLFPGLENVRVVLNAANGWRHTWTDLPTYANGSPVEWGVKEILVGAETTLADGVSFANWTAVYSQPAKTDADDDGITDHWSYTVTNSVRRAQLYLVKTDGGGNALTGAVFELVEVDRYGNPVSGAVTRTGTTDSGGMLQFDNLKYTTRYRLTETAAPSGYKGFEEPAYLTLAADGTVTVEPHSHVEATSYAYVVSAVNTPIRPLPNTGGNGLFGYYMTGGMLMLLAVCGYMLPRWKKERGAETD